MAFLAQIRRLARLLARLEVWPVALCIAIGLVWPYLLPVAVITAAFFWVVRWVAYGRFSVRTPADWPIALLLVMAGVTLWVTALPERTLPQVYRLLAGIALYYAFANWCDSSKKLRLVISGTILASLMLAILSPVSVEWSFGKLSFIPTGLYQRFALLVSDTAHPNVMAGSLVILLPIPLCWMFFSWSELKGLERILSSLGTVFVLGVLLLTQSRGAWIALGAIIVVFSLLRWRRGWIALILGAGVAIAVVYLLGIERIARGVAAFNTLSGESGRLATWARATYMIQDFPFTGIGMGSFLEVLDTFYPFYPPSPGKIFHAHNLFLQVAVDLGIPGLIAWLAILLCTLSISWQLFRYGRMQSRSVAIGIGAGLFCSQLALVFHGLVDSVTWGMVRPAPIVWAIWGLTVASWSVIISGNPESP